MSARRIYVAMSFALLAACGSPTPTDVPDSARTVEHPGSSSDRIGYEGSGGRADNDSTSSPPPSASGGS